MLERRQSHRVIPPYLVSSLAFILFYFILYLFIYFFSFVIYYLQHLFTQQLGSRGTEERCLFHLSSPTYSPTYLLMANYGNTPLPPSSFLPSPHSLPLFIPFLYFILNDMQRFGRGQFAHTYVLSNETNKNVNFDFLRYIQILSTHIKRQK